MTVQFGYLGLWLGQRFGEFGIAILLTILAKRLIPGTWRTAILAGIAGGAGIFISYALAYALTDGIFAP